VSDPEKPADTAEPEPAPISDPNAALREAVGATPDPRRAPTPNPYGEVDDDDDVAPVAGRPRRRRTIAIATTLILVGLVVAVLVFLGRANAERYLITCGTDHVAAEQGRAFPPWGSRPIVGPEWKPIELPSNAECRPRETDDLDELARWYLDVLVDRASTTLAAHDLLEAIPAAAPPGTPTAASPLDTAAQQLDQALLLARAPERRDQRQEIERLVGDVAYWRASLRLRDAGSALADAAKQFDAAAARRPRHATDASAWATFLRRIGDELHGGPAGGTGAPRLPPVASDAVHAPAPTGVALPVEAQPGSTTVAAPPTSNAADAGVPSGGVLL
jgi:hypothetical protein